MKDTLKFFEISQPAEDRTHKKFFTQLSCHFEEFLEGVEALGNKSVLNEDLEAAIAELRGNYPEEEYAQAYFNINRAELADSLADQYVTLIGTARAAGIDIETCIAEVEASNLSKFVYVGDAEITPEQLGTFAAHANSIEEQGRYKGVYWKRVNDYVVWYDQSGKILKGPNYFEPNLEKFV